MKRLAAIASVGAAAAATLVAATLVAATLVAAPAVAAPAAPAVAAPAAPAVAAPGASASGARLTEIGPPGMLSAARNGDPGDDDSFAVTLAAAGRRAAFHSRADNLAPHGGSEGAVFLKDADSGAISAVVRNRWQRPVGWQTRYPIVSDDGRRVLFETRAPLAPGDQNRANDVYVRDLRTNRTLLASRAVGGGTGDRASVWGALSANGRTAVWMTRSTNQARRDRNGRWDVYARDLHTGVVRWVSRRPDGGASTGAAKQPSVSGTGRLVAFLSDADDLAAVDKDGGQLDAFVWDRTTGRIAWASPAAPPLAGVVEAVISPDGRWLLQRYSGGRLMLTRLTRDGAPRRTLQLAKEGTVSAQPFTGDGTVVVYQSSGHCHLRHLPSGRVHQLSAVTPAWPRAWYGGCVIAAGGQFAAYVVNPRHRTEAGVVLPSQVYRVRLSWSGGRE